MKKSFRRIGAGVAVAALLSGTVMMFTGCTTQHPEVTITYEFHGETYEVEYTLSREDAPRTVTHFIELADAGYYDYDDETNTGFIIHDYTSEYLMTGGYRLVEGELEEVDYFTVVKDLEESLSKPFTKSVWMNASSAGSPAKGEALYSVFGEAPGKIDSQYGREYGHRQGALVMYYTDKSETEQVVVERSDKGKGNDGEILQEENYAVNSATSLFYTWLSTSSSSSQEGFKTNNYTVFGMAKNYTEDLEEGLLKAIKEYIEGLAEDESFTQDQEVQLNQYEPFQRVREDYRTKTFKTPITEPIILRSVEVTKY